MTTQTEQVWVVLRPWDIPSRVAGTGCFEIEAWVSAFGNRGATIDNVARAKESGYRAVRAVLTWENPK